MALAPQRIDRKPWYRQFWPWFLIFLPSTSIFAGFALLYFALDGPDGMVIDDYYKVGRAYNRNIERDQQAEAQGIRGQLTVRADGIADLALLSNAPLNEVALNLTLMHPTERDLDMTVPLVQGIQGTWSANVGQIPRAQWYVRVEDQAGSWRVAGLAWLPSDEMMALLPSSQH